MWPLDPLPVKTKGFQLYFWVFQCSHELLILLITRTFKWLGLDTHNHILSKCHDQSVCHYQIDSGDESLNVMQWLKLLQFRCSQDICRNIRASTSILKARNVFNKTSTNSLEDKSSQLAYSYHSISLIFSHTSKFRANSVYRCKRFVWYIFIIKENIVILINAILLIDYWHGLPLDNMSCMPKLYFAVLQKPTESKSMKLLWESSHGLERSELGPISGT